MSIAEAAATTQTTLASLATLGLPAAQMVLLLDQAIAQCVLQRGAVTSYAIAGRSLTASLGELRALRAYYAELALQESGGEIQLQGSAFAFAPELPR
jgi:hypothetical protein